jgi:uncharacterized protein (TIGR00730 family)
VYGGGNVGLMGIVADACLAAGGRWWGDPRALLEWEVGHEGLTRLEVVDSMHTRKARMAELADGFIALPGGLGTFEELFEISPGPSSASTASRSACSTWTPITGRWSR